MNPPPLDPDCLCEPPTKEERAANSRALDKLSVANRFRLMFGMPMLEDKPPAETKL